MENNCNTFVKPKQYVVHYSSFNYDIQCFSIKTNTCVVVHMRISDFSTTDRKCNFTIQSAAISLFLLYQTVLLYEAYTGIM